MRGVIRWTEEVINGLYPLQWQVIGYAQYPDGTLDYNRPYHSMPNPNARISKVLSMYSENTREQLRVLLNAVENTNLTRVNTGTDKRMDSSEYISSLPEGRTQGPSLAKMPSHHLLPNNIQTGDVKDIARHRMGTHPSLPSIELAAERNDANSE